MRFVHTADWHLGRIFFGVHLTADQAHVLDQIVDLVKSSGAGALVVAGDVFDRSVPPPDAVDLLDDVLSRLALDIGVPVILIAGNHDSPQRLQFGARLLRSRHLHIFGGLTSDISAVTLEDEAGPIDFYGLPYAEPPVVRQCFEDEEVVDHHTAMRRCVRAVEAIHSNGRRRVLIAHAFVQGGSACESERPLTVGGAGTVDPACFDGFHYVALGHLHDPQQFAEGRVRYSGSLLRYSFTEGQQKAAKVVEIDGKGKCTVEVVPLVPMRQIRTITGTFEEILRGPQDGQAREDYLNVVVTDRGAILDAMTKIRQVYPNALHLERPSLTSAIDGNGSRPDHTKMTDAELFGDFFRQVAGEPLTEAQSAAFATVIDAMRQREREAVA
ncbi:MAG TPA: exonuclease SbcCD subunit D [Tepidisphaeraceae bacterium]|jgi:exonuclease SbcD